MARIKITDLPKGRKISKEEMQNVIGGQTDTSLTSIIQMHEMNQSFSLQYLMMQQKIQQETREFNLISNIMKTRHEAAKNAINNVR